MKRENIEKAVKIDERITEIESNIDSWKKAVKICDDSISLSDGAYRKVVKSISINFDVMKTLAIADLEGRLDKAKEELKQLD